MTNMEKKDSRKEEAEVEDSMTRTVSMTCPTCGCDSPRPVTFLLTRMLFPSRLLSFVFSLPDIFSQFFGGGFGGGGGGRGRKPTKTPDVQHQVGLTLADFYRGRTKKLKVTRQVLCQSCKGKGSLKEGAVQKCTGQQNQCTWRKACTALSTVDKSKPRAAQVC
jgi:hypothetical protein